MRENGRADVNSRQDRRNLRLIVYDFCAGEAAYLSHYITFTGRLFATALLLLLPLLSAYHSSVRNAREISRQKVVAEQQVSVRDSLLTSVENDVAAIYGCVADSVSNATYFEFANNNILSFYEMMAEYYDENISSIADPEVSSLVTDRYMQLLNKAQAALWDKANQLPSFYKSDLPVAAVLYYDSLFSCRKPFLIYSRK